jgi:hypothetical protein
LAGNEDSENVSDHSAFWAAVWLPSAKNQLPSVSPMADQLVTEVPSNSALMEHRWRILCKKGEINEIRLHYSDGVNPQVTLITSATEK